MRRGLALLGLALLLALGFFAPALAGGSAVLVGIKVGEFSWSEGQPLKKPDALAGHSATLSIRGSAPPVGKKWPTLVVGLPVLPSGKKPYLVFTNAEVTSAQATKEAEYTGVVFEHIDWTHFTETPPQIDVQ